MGIEQARTGSISPLDLQPSTNPNGPLPQSALQIEDFPNSETRLEQAESRTEQAKTRTERAETRTEQAETRTEQAKTRAEKAEARTEQAETRTEQVETRSKRAIRASEFNYRRLFEAAREGILILEVDTGRISDVNPFLIEMLGFSHGELAGTPIWELGPFADIVANKARFEDLQRQGYVLSQNVPMEAKDGRKITVEFISNAYQAGDKQVIQCNIRDMTQRKLAEDERGRLNAELEQRVVERTEQFQAANEELQVFNFSVAHDLRAPARSVLGFAKRLQKEIGPSLSEENLRQLVTIQKVANGMGNLIDDLLAFSMIGQAKIQKTAVDLDELVRETLEDFQAETKERSIAWTIQPLPVVQADRALLRMVFVNLMTNAMKFTRTRAEAKIEIGCLSGDGEAVIFIRDNGVGFDPSYAAKLFGVFERLHSTAEFEGTGIGLANVRRIVHRFGGRTWAEGVIDGGAVISFSIPK